MPDGHPARAPGARSLAGGKHGSEAPVAQEAAAAPSPATIPTRIPYKPVWRVSEPDSVLVPMTVADQEAYKALCHNPLRLEAQRMPLPTAGASRKRSALNAHTDSAVAQHYNKRRDIGRDAREFSPIIPLKRFNNWTKSALISLYGRGTHQGSAGTRVLDMGCGKGGDLLKWHKQHPSMLVMVDIAEVSVAQAKDRYLEGHFKWAAEFYAFDCFRSRLDEKIPAAVLDPGFDSVSLQFCMHYGWDSEEHARTMLENVARFLRPGGHFIGTTLDAETLLARLDATPEPDALSFGNDRYRIEFEHRYAPGTQPFGNKYKFWLEDAVDDVAEYVVDWDTLERMAGEVGLHLVYKARFDQVLSDGYAEPALRSLLERMKVIDPQLAATGVVTPDMPPDLWDVCTLYLGFAFEKVDSDT